MKTDLALARQEISALREERDKLEDAVRRQLGQQLDQVGTGELVARIDELSRQNAELTAERDALTRGKAEWKEKLAEAEEDQDAARASLRREYTNPDALEAGWALSSGGAGSRRRVGTPSQSSSSQFL